MLGLRQVMRRGQREVLPKKPVGTLAMTTPLVRDASEGSLPQPDRRQGFPAPSGASGVESAKPASRPTAASAVASTRSSRRREEDDGDTEEIEAKLDRKPRQAEAPFSMRKTAWRGASNVRWADDEPVAKLNKKPYYSRALVNGHELH
ncbi:hypothetical protein MRX96_046415 [Rhipicephalus microplus]